MLIWSEDSSTCGKDEFLSMVGAFRRLMLLVCVSEVPLRAFLRFPAVEVFLDGIACLLACMIGSMNPMLCGFVVLL
jgi:hypothetical protein